MSFFLFCLCRNRGSIGYMSYSEAMLTNWSFASIVNKHGNIAPVDSAVMRDVMHERMDDMHNLTVSLVDSDNENAYPLLGYSYLLIRHTTMTDCATAVELYRYIEWLLHDEFARDTAAELGMAQVTHDVYVLVRDTVLYTMKCGGGGDGGGAGRSVRQLVDEQKHLERLEVWRVPLLIAGPIIAAVICLMLGYIVYQQWRLRYSGAAYSGTNATLHNHSKAHYARFLSSIQPNQEYYLKNGHLY